MAGDRTRFDYVIVGAGSAGCVLARRLSDHPSVTVCLIEAGGPDTSRLIRVPLGLAALAHKPELNWGHFTVPQRHLDGRQLAWPRGKVLGGSSSVNAMCYVRGAPENYDEWAANGAPGWSWRELRPYFLKAEDNERGAGEHHAAGGPLAVSDLRSSHALSRAFVAGGAEVQLPHNRDFNGASQEGLGLYQVTQRNGERCSAARAYLAPARDRPNLTLVLNALAERVVFDGPRAAGVQIRVNDTALALEAEREVLLCAGAINSPQLLMLSGVGPASHLAEHGVASVADRPGVGRNLQDHLDVLLIVRDKSRTAYGLGLAPGPNWRGLRDAFAYWRKRTGMYTSNVAEAGGFARSRRARELPDIQFHFIPAIVKDHGATTVYGYGFSLHCCNLYPEARGSIRLASAKPHRKPLIDPNYLSSERDLEVMIDAARLGRRILESAALAHAHGGEMEPGPGTDSSADWERFIRAKAETIYHPVGTCRIGLRDDEDAVVDPALRVHGVERLRVVDASVMPRLIGGNTNAPVIAIAERAADLISRGGQ